MSRKTPIPAIVTIEQLEREQERLRTLARERLGRYRSGRPHIDYFPDEHAVTTIGSLSHVGEDASSILNRIVREWSENRHDRAVPAASHGARGKTSRPAPNRKVRIPEP